jgi:hypothetical protein
MRVSFEPGGCRSSELAAVAVTIGVVGVAAH